jgi:hypothetical protein
VTAQVWQNEQNVCISKKEQNVWPGKFILQTAPVSTGILQVKNAALSDHRSRFGTAVKFGGHMPEQ